MSQPRLVTRQFPLEFSCTDKWNRTTTNTAYETAALPLCYVGISCTPRRIRTLISRLEGERAVHCTIEANKRQRHLVSYLGTSSFTQRFPRQLGRHRKSRTFVSGLSDRRTEPLCYTPIKVSPKGVEPSTS